eukprot:TRINITY_DN9937_c0_g1_i1.p1 TRINITY_DN9937_c0_g1~~TRINITY_DN9937_c0_g1_i1.p1  ORF type:complete len:388 (-),score=129.37 TRINITY_DN9937_c0_g1_i1:194-1357(-)
MASGPGESEQKDVDLLQVGSLEHKQLLKTVKFGQKHMRMQEKQRKRLEIVKKCIEEVTAKLKNVNIMISEKSSLLQVLTISMTSEEMLCEELFENLHETSKDFSLDIIPPGSRKPWHLRYLNKKRGGGGGGGGDSGGIVDEGRIQVDATLNPEEDVVDKDEVEEEEEDEDEEETNGEEDLVIQRELQQAQEKMIALRQKQWEREMEIERRKQERREKALEAKRKREEQMLQTFQGLSQDVVDVILGAENGQRGARKTKKGVEQENLMKEVIKRELTANSHNHADDGLVKGVTKEKTKFKRKRRSFKKRTVKRRKTADYTCPVEKFKSAKVEPVSKVPVNSQSKPVKAESVSTKVKVKVEREYVSTRSNSVVVKREEPKKVKIEPCQH